ncbi:MAG: N,N-dimethylformamidase beta subunit family domain-containing protein [Gaiellaceae bacterium]
MRQMYCLALALLVGLVAAPTADAAGLSIRPHEFSPRAARLTVKVTLPAKQRVGVQLATRAGKPLGWIVEPAKQRRVRLRWKGFLAGRLVDDGDYRVRLVSGGRVLSSSPLHVDRIAPTLSGFGAHNRGRPFAGDRRLLTTISPNRDGVRDFARIGFTLEERSRVRVEVARTSHVKEPVYRRNAVLGPGPQTFTWYPRKTTPARTYLVRLTVRDKAGNERTYGSTNAVNGRRPLAPIVRVLGLEAGFTRESYREGQVASLAISTDAPWFKLLIARAGGEDAPTYDDTVMHGVPVTRARWIDWTARRDRRHVLRVPIGAWGTGLFFAKLIAADGRVGFAPFVLRPSKLGSSRVAVVLPTNTWQAYNFRDDDGNGWGDTWYAKGRENTVRLGRPFLRRGVPPHYRKYDVGFLRWLHRKAKIADFLSEGDLERVRTAEELLASYDLLVFPGHMEYVTRHELDLVEGYRNLGGNLMFLSANNFFWEIRKEGRTLRRMKRWREYGRPESALLGVQYRANDRGQVQRPFVVRSTVTAPWLWAGTGLVDGATFGAELGGYGIEIDATTPFSPPGTLVLADIPDLFGPGVTAQMTLYETTAGARVFSAGAIDFGGTATRPTAARGQEGRWTVGRVLENLWARLASP